MRAVSSFREGTMFHWFSFASTFMDFHVSLCFIDSSDFWWTSLLNATFSWGLGVFASYAVMASGMWPGASWGKGKSGLRELLANSTYCTSCFFWFKSQKRSKNRRHILSRESFSHLPFFICFVKSTGGFSHIRDPNKIRPRWWRLKKWFGSLSGGIQCCIPKTCI